MFGKSRRIISLLCMLIIIISSFSGCKIQYIEEETTSVDEAVIDTSIVVLNLWYYDDTYTAYLRQCADDYQAANENIRVNLRLVNESGYVDTLVDATYKGKSVDIFMVENDSLEEMRLAGLVDDNNMGDIYSKYNYSPKALSACTYNKKLIAYPLSFNTSFIVYNKEYVNTLPATFEDIKALADVMEVPEGVSIKSVFDCDLNDIFFNYGFLGGVLSIGGSDGDDKSKNFRITGELENAVMQYQQLIEFFSLDINSADYYTCIKDFEDGKTVFTIADTKMFKKLVIDAINETATEETESNEEATEETEAQTETTTEETVVSVVDSEEAGEFYGVIAFPDLSESIPCSPLSTVTTLVVNPFSNNVPIAESFAKYVTYTNAENLFELSGKLSCRNIYGDDEIFSQIYASFDKSTPKLKVMYNEEFYMLLEVSMHLMAAGEDGFSALTAVNHYLGVEWQEGISPSAAFDVDPDAQ